ncbi:4Fe-4S dicluster domain-containing protein [Anaeroselena agilis]|uniref:4Fe-4S binding protein n=1 Tax=Anaeroselena agilis TaxID=3063788 RepID=A0ABU3NSU1_9FIRM|nr:4Fe-4S binding protein [Selenomonadales bacterium 4137-cl]
MKLTGLRFWRTLLPATMLALVVTQVARHEYPLPPDAGLLLWLTRLDPLLLVGHLRWEGTFPSWGWLPLATLLVTFAAGRVFCGWLCPVGGLLAVLHSLQGVRLGPSRRDGPPRWTRHLRVWRFYWLILLLAVLLLGSGWTLYLSPFHLLTSEMSRLWAGQVPWAALALVTVGLITFPRFWCVYLCPSGLLLSVLARWRLWAVKKPAGCINCGACSKVCPTGASASGTSSAGADCLLCGRCAERCPINEGIALGERKGGGMAPASGGGLFKRREIIRAGVALTVAAAAAPTLIVAKGDPPLRPPGALAEAEFLARCSRCGRCIKACPGKCLKAAPLSKGAAVFLTPMIVPREARCELTQDCQRVCPTGAISHLPVAKAIIGFAEIDRTRCLGWTEGKLCLLCQEQCPQHAITSDGLHRPSVSHELCVGCGACENGCPVEGAAIVVRPQPSRRRP